MNPRLGGVAEPASSFRFQSEPPPTSLPEGRAMNVDGSAKIKKNFTETKIQRGPSMGPYNKFGPALGEFVQPKIPQTFSKGTFN